MRDCMSNGIVKSWEGVVMMVWMRAWREVATKIESQQKNITPLNTLEVFLLACGWR